MVGSELHQEMMAADEEVKWEHDPQRDGSGCTWCGAFAQVNSDNECQECWES